MELSELLGRRFDCQCGRTHAVPVRRFVYEPGAVEGLPEVVRQCAAPSQVRRVVVVGDARTWNVCGIAARSALKRSAVSVDEVLVPDSATGGPVCDEATFNMVSGELRAADPDMVVAVGSGVINDLCKWSAFELDRPYLVVATAASMNGYAAANVAAKVAGVKVLVEARPPLAVLAEPAVIEQAPREMTAAGFGDTIAKYQSNADWVMNNLLFDEYYCDFCAGIISTLEPLYLRRPEDLRDGASGAVKGLFEALFFSGIAMTLVGTSAPASGGEHLLSHTLDMMADVQGQRHDLHGRQVGLGTILSAALYERILAMERPVFAEVPRAVDRDFWAVPAVVEAVAKQYEAKRAHLEQARRRIAEQKTWEQLRVRLAAQVKPAERIRNWLRQAGGATSFAHVGCSRQRLRAAIMHMHEIRRRFTVVDLAWLVGVLPGAVDDLIDEWLTDSR